MFRRRLLNSKTKTKAGQQFQRQIELRAELEGLLTQRNYLVAENVRIQVTLDADLTQLLDRQSDTNRLLAKTLAAIEQRERDLVRKIGDLSVLPDPFYTREAEIPCGPTGSHDVAQAIEYEHPQHRDD